MINVRPVAKFLNSYQHVGFTHSNSEQNLDSAYLIAKGKI